MFFPPKLVDLGHSHSFYTVPLNFMLKKKQCFTPQIQWPRWFALAVVPDWMRQVKPCQPNLDLLTLPKS